MTDYPGALWSPSPNYQAGRGGSKITAVVLHATAGPGAVSWFQQTTSQVSAHYVVEQDGTITQCVREADTAWHAGVVTPNSQFFGGVNPNRWALGIEHTRDRTNTSPITPAQLAASLDLVRSMLARHGPLTILTHDQIDVGRICPGPAFPLKAFKALLNGGDELSAAEKTELAQYRKDKPYYDTLLGQILPSALGTMEEAAGDDPSPLADTVRSQCRAVRDATGL